MAPNQPRVELDMDRKEELIIAKQLRACRVNIIPRNVDTSLKMNSLSPSPSPRTPESPHLQDQKNNESSAIAMRYWNQQNSAKTSENTNKMATEQDVVDELATKMQKLAQQKANNLKLSKMAMLPTVPDIRNKMKENALQGSPKILVTDTETRKVPYTDTDIPTQNRNAETEKYASTACQSRNKFSGNPEAQANTNMPSSVEQNQNGKESGRRPPMLPFLNDINLLKQYERKSPQRLEEQANTIPDLPEKKKINAHIGHIENRPKFGDLPFLNDIKNLIGSKPDAEDIKQKQENIDFSNSTRKSPTKQEPVQTEEKIQNDKLKHYADRKMKSPSPKIVTFFENKIGSKPNAVDIEQKQENIDYSNNPGKSPTKQEPVQTEEKIQNDKLKHSADRKMKSPSPKIVTFFENKTLPSTSQINSYVEPHDTIANVKDEQEANNSNIKSNKPPKLKKAPKYNIKIDEKSNMSKLADQIIPQLNTMQKNYLGLLFFNELSQNIVEDIVAQQLSMMPGTKLASVINSLEQEVCDTAVPLMLNSVSEDLRTALVCETFGELTTQEKAGVLFTTGDDVMEVCNTITDFGGRGFKKALIKNMIANEDKQFMDEIVHEHQKDNQRMNPRPQGASRDRLSVYSDDQRHLSSADDENYNSAEESLADVGDDEVYQYEYYDFENK